MKFIRDMLRDTQDAQRGVDKKSFENCHSDVSQALVNTGILPAAIQGNGVVQPSFLRRIFFVLALLLLLAWTVWTLGYGLSWTQSLYADTSGELALRLTQQVFGDSPEVHRAFLEEWHRPGGRDGWLAMFMSTFWTRRLMMWGIPATVLGIAALCLKPPK